jgi:hypothetical protein
MARGSDWSLSKILATATTVITLIGAGIGVILWIQANLLTIKRNAILDVMQDVEHLQSQQQFVLEELEKTQTNLNSNANDPEKKDSGSPEYTFFVRRQESLQKQRNFLDRQLMKKQEEQRMLFNEK